MHFSNENFSRALELMKRGSHMSRSGWNGKNLCVYIWTSTEMDNEQFSNDVIINPQFRIYNFEKKTIDSWIPSVSDLLAEDWFEI